MAENAFAEPVGPIPNLPAAGQLQNQIWRSFRRESPIRACSLDLTDLRRLYQIVNARQIEVRDRMMAILAQQPGESPEEYASRRTRVFNAFVTGVVISGANGEVLSGDGDYIFDDHLLNSRIVSVTIDTGFAPKTKINVTPIDIGHVHLDFSRPPLLNFGVLPMTPTPNQSAWSVSAQTETWAVAFSTRLEEFFAETATKTNWLHGGATYDVMLMLLGWPISLWAALRIGNLVTGAHILPTPIHTAIYVFSFFLSANLFRALFSYSRWVFPKVDLKTSKSRQGLHRTIWGALILGVIGSAIWDGIKALA